MVAGQQPTRDANGSCVEISEVYGGMCMVCDSDSSDFKSEGLNITKKTIPDRHEGAARPAGHPERVLTRQRR